MSYLNSISLIGFVGTDPEQRQARSNGRSSPSCPSRRSALGRRRRTNGARKLSGIASVCFGHGSPSGKPAPLQFRDSLHAREEAKKIAVCK
jgi:hypothetical protein